MSETWKRLLVIPLAVAITAALIAWPVDLRPIIVFPLTQIIVGVMKARQNAERDT